MRRGTDYLYYRELYSSSYYAKKGIIKIKLRTGKLKYLYFDANKHMKFTDNIKYATRFSSRPRNYDRYVEYIKKQFLDSVVTYEEEVVVKSKILKMQ